MSWGAQLFCIQTQNSLPIARPNLGIADIEDSGDPNSRTLLEFIDAELDRIFLSISSPNGRAPILFNMGPTILVDERRHLEPPNPIRHPQNPRLLATMGKIPSPLALTPTLRTTTLLRPSSRSCLQNQVRHATFIQRPRRPYTFTQLVQLSDGSSYIARTTSPQPLYVATKDTRNTLTWQPSEKSLRNVELDEAGKLAAFRGRFGTAFDGKQEGEEEGSGGDLTEDGYGSLISSYANQDTSALKDAAPTKKK
ncbi:unnamed protein product [Clonostachys rhizophaga]|uniref:Ribosomal protein bL31m N-terminal domain-containing protein n=1 Tax=Clonostachys rhizophaga TaxID=160324 RepID=A0A9N9W016_9HYPO|nr:unnamed protein product [Clonostachys rhizophaga]